MIIVSIQLPIQFTIFSISKKTNYFDKFFNILRIKNLNFKFQDLIKKKV